MWESSVNRREVLKTGSALGMTSLAGCAEIPGVETSLSYTGDEDQIEPEPVATEDYTLPEDHTIEEWSGELELNEDYPYWIKKMSPQSQRGEKVAESSECFILECEVEVPESGDEVELFLLSESNQEDFRENASPEVCGEISPAQGYDYTHCLPNISWHDSDDVEDNVVEIKPGETKYVRYLVPDTDFWIVIDPTDTVGVLGTASAGYDSRMNLEPKIRLLKNSFDEAREDVLTEFDEWFSEMSSPSTNKTIGGTQQFAHSICGSGRASDFSSESVDDLGNDVNQLKSYFDFIDSMLADIEHHFSVEVQEGFTDRLESMMKWSSTALPVIASLITIAKNACSLANHNPSQAEQTEGEKVENLLMSVAGLVVQATFLKLGVARQITSSVIKSAETFVMGYVRQLAGLRMFAYVVNSLAVNFEDSIISTITDFFQRIVSEATELFIDRDEDLLDQVSEDDDWESMGFLDENKWECDGHSQDVVGASTYI